MWDVDEDVKMSLSEEEMLFDNNHYVRIYGSVDGSDIATSDTFLSSGSFEVSNEGRSDPAG